MRIVTILITVVFLANIEQHLGIVTESLPTTIKVLFGLFFSVAGAQDIKELLKGI